MATTTAGTRLTTRQRSQQLSIRNRAVRELVPLWSTLDPTNIDQTQPAWVALVLALIGRHREQAVVTALDYYREYRRAETGQLVVPVLPVPPGGNVQQFITSLMVTGPIGIKQRLAKGMEPEKAKKLALVETSGAVGRHVLNGGREALIEAAESDELAVGFARVTGPNPCWWCSMLASRGFAYKSRTTALLTKTGERYHDHCACGVEIAFHDDAELPPRTADWERLWIEATAGKSGKEAQQAFREAHAQFLADAA